MFSHCPADVIFKLVTFPFNEKLFVGKESGVGLMLAALCIQRCNFAGRERFDAKFVRERQRVCGTADKDWVISEESGSSGSLHWLSSMGHSPFIQDYGENRYFDNFNAFSGVLPLFQPVEPAQLKPKQDQETADTKKTRFFSWYPEQDHMSEDVVRSFEHHISPKVCKGNLDWNARVVVMDLLLLLAEKENVDDADKCRLLRKLFPGTKALDNPKYPEYSGTKTKLNGLLLFFSYFWVPALEFFRNVHEKGDVGDKQDADVAIGEVCHVLGITCRTQWMLQGFLCQPGTKKVKGKIEYLPCRFDRLLSLLCRDPDSSDSKAVLRRFLNDISEIYKLLRKRYLEKNEVKFKTDCGNEKVKEEFTLWAKDILENLPTHLKTEYENGYKHTCFPATVNFLLRNSSFKCKIDRMCADPRQMDNVYLFSLLDFS